MPKELDCDGPYCIPKLDANGKQTGRVDCPPDCTLCGLYGDAGREDDPFEQWPDEV